MKRYGGIILVVVVMMVAATGFINAEGVSPTESRILNNVTMTSYVADKYLGFGSGSIVHDDTVIVQDIFWNLNNGWYFGLWGSISPNGGSDFGDEVDYIGGWGDEVMDGINVDLSLWYFNEPPVDRHGDNDVLRPQVKISTVIGEYGLAFTTRYYRPQPNGNARDGWLIGPSVSRSVGLYGDVSLFNCLELNYDTGAFDADNGWIFNNVTTLSWQLTENISWKVVEASWFVPVHLNDARKSDVVWTSGLKMVL